MVRLNLMEPPPEETPRKKPSEEEVPVPEEPKTDSSDFLEEMESLSHGTSEIEPPPVAEEPPIEPQPAFAASATEESTTSDEESEYTFESTFPKKKLFVVLGIFIGLVVSAILIYLLVISGGGEKTASPSQATTKPVTQKTATQANQRNLMLQSRYAAIQARNQFYVQTIATIFHLQVRGVDPVLLVSTPDRLTISLKGDSRDQIAQFRIRFKQQMPGVPLELEGSGFYNEGGQQKILVDFSLPIQANVGGAGASITIPRSMAQVQSQFQQFAQNNGLRLTYFKTGKQAREGLFQATNFYAHLSGTKSRLLQFLQQTAQQLPALRFQKIELGTQNFRSGRNVRLMARITGAILLPGL